MTLRAPRRSVETLRTTATSAPGRSGPLRMGLIAGPLNWTAARLLRVPQKPRSSLSPDPQVLETLSGWACPSILTRATPGAETPPARGRRSTAHLGDRFDAATGVPLVPRGHDVPIAHMTSSAVFGARRVACGPWMRCPSRSGATTPDRSATSASPGPNGSSAGSARRSTGFPSSSIPSTPTEGLLRPTSSGATGRAPRPRGAWSRRPDDLRAVAQAPQHAPRPPGD